MPRADETGPAGRQCTSTADDNEPVSQDQLWAPWRLSYIVTTKEHESDGCFLCRDRDEAAGLLVARGERTLTVLNRFPYNNGHLLIAPAAHKASLNDLDDDELLECLHELKRMTTALSAVLSPDGFNIGLNLGQVAGAGLPGHLHWHVVPRWNGDTNFMPVIADVKVIPQSLEALLAALRAELNGSTSTIRPASSFDASVDSASL